MSRKKLQHFADLEKWPHVYELGVSETCARKGAWGDPVVVELGCGKGVYTLALAQRFPEKTLVGVDVKGDRIWHGAKATEGDFLPNVHFLRTRIEDLEACFEAGELDEIWITFPDPHPRKGKAKKRLTSHRFLSIYKKLLKPDGFLHLKTDAKTLFDYSVEVLKGEGWELVEEIRDLYGQSVNDPLLTEIQTDYEKRFLAEGRPIYYLKARYHA